MSKEWTTGEVQSLQQYGDDLAAGVTSKLNGASLQQQQDSLAVAQNGGVTGSTTEDADMADAEGDDGMDDDMMDKISSSPSIDDGGYPFPHLWPQRADSLTLCTPPKPPPLSQACGESSSPFLETPEYFPLGLPSDEIDKDDLQAMQSNKYRYFQGELPDASHSESNYDESRMDDISTPASKVRHHIESYDQDFELDLLAEEILAEARNMLLESDDVFHASNHSTYASEKKQLELKICHEDREHPPTRCDEEIPTIPYEPTSDDEDEDDDFEISLHPYPPSRVDSGWGGECLHDLEDIDFEFVYALHTFVATVEGQANATKGDTMVLLDDSNSYWWLVRVVKDSSIGWYCHPSLLHCVLISVPGYLPAEHIETPTERLARLNKHRNIDVRS